MVIFGGEDDAVDRMKNVLILDLNERKFYDSKITMQPVRAFRAISMYDRYDIILSGFIRNANEYNINVPSELLTLFSAYLETETIYLNAVEEFDTPLMMKIGLNDLLEGKKSDLSLEYESEDYDSY